MGSRRPDEQELIYDWNLVGDVPEPHKVVLNDESLRDGLQSPSITDFAAASAASVGAASRRIVPAAAGTVRAESTVPSAGTASSDGHGVKSV